MPRPEILIPICPSLQLSWAGLAMVVNGRVLLLACFLISYAYFYQPAMKPNNHDPSFGLIADSTRHTVDFTICLNHASTQLTALIRELEILF
jgi:hypothetical protein